MLQVQAPEQTALEPHRAPPYRHGAVDLRAVEHESEVTQAAQSGLPGHVLSLSDQEERAVQRQGDGHLLSTGDKETGSSKSSPLDGTSTPSWNLRSQSPS